MPPEKETETIAIIITEWKNVVNLRAWHFPSNFFQEIQNSIYAGQSIKWEYFML